MKLILIFILSLFFVQALSLHLQTLKSLQTPKGHSLQNHFGKPVEGKKCVDCDDCHHTPPRPKPHPKPTPPPTPKPHPKPVPKPVPGHFDGDHSIIKVLNKEIVAGGTAVLSILPIDAKDLEINPNRDLTKYVVIVTSSTGKVVNATHIVKGKNIEFSATLTESGINYWSIKLDNVPVQCRECNTNVTPGPVVLNKSVVRISTVNNAAPQVIINGQTLKGTNKTPINGNVEFRDQYNNVITEIDRDKLFFKKKPNISGMDMTEIELDTDTSSNNFRLLLESEENDLNNTLRFILGQNDMLSYRHLVEGNGYKLKFTVSNSSEDLSYENPLQITTDTDDTGHGNGKYVIEKTILSKTSIEIDAGTTEDFDITLMTNNNLIYNDDVPLQNIKYSLSSPDDTFKMDIVKKPNTTYGVYTATITSNKATDQAINITVMIRNKNNVDEKVPFAIVFNVDPRPPATNAKVSAKVTGFPDKTTKWDKTIEIKFKLLDEFLNPYTGQDLMPKIVLRRDNVNIVDAKLTKTLLPDNETYSFVYSMPDYPSRDCTVQLFFDDGTTSYSISNKMNTFITSDPNTQAIQYKSKSLDNMVVGNAFDLNVYMYDVNNVCVDNEDTFPLTVVLTGPTTDPNPKTVFYSFKKLTKHNNEVSTDPKQNCKQFYKVDSSKGDVLKSGAYNVDLFLGLDENATGYKRHMSIQVKPTDVDITKFVAKWANAGNFNSQAILAGTPLMFQVFGYDKYGNQAVVKENIDIFIDPLDQSQNIVADNGNQINDYFLKQEIVDGILMFNIVIRKSQQYKISFKYLNDTFAIKTQNGPNDITVIPGPCSNKFPNIDYSAIQNIHTGSQGQVLVTCQDEFKNKLSVGGNTITGKVTVLVNKDSNNKQDVNSSLLNNGDGTYSLMFDTNIEGTYQIAFTLDGSDYGTQQSYDIISIANVVCDSGKVKCPNDLGKCVNSIYDCIDNSNCINPSNSFSKQTPFCCKVNGHTKYVKSQKDCDCDTGKEKCKNLYIYNKNRLNVCVDSDKVATLCPNFKPISCTVNQYKCPDGTCKANSRECSNERVCPIGFKMCPDQTCKKDLADCSIYTNICSESQARCMDQTCKDSNNQCPTTPTCPKTSQVVCPDGSCVDNEVLCAPLLICTGSMNVMCPMYMCASSVSNCAQLPACPNGKSNCNGACQTTCNTEALKRILHK